MQKVRLLYRNNRLTKPGFSNPEDLIVLMWRTGGPQPVLGQTVLPVLTTPPPEENSSDPLEPELPPRQPLKGMLQLLLDKYRYRYISI